MNLSLCVLSAVSSLARPDCTVTRDRIIWDYTTDLPGLEQLSRHHIVIPRGSRDPVTSLPWHEE